MILLPALTEQHLRKIDECIEHLEALADDLTYLSSDTHQCKHRTVVTTTAEATARRLRRYVKQHAVEGCPPAAVPMGDQEEQSA